MDEKEVNANDWVEAENYEAPRLEIIEVRVEKGFAGSNSGSGESYNQTPW